MAEQFYNNWLENKTKEEVIKGISELRKNIKNKHQALQRQIADSTELLEKQWKPVSEPLKTLLEEHDETELQNNKINERKRKINRDADEHTPTKQFILTPEQGVKRKQKLNVPAQEDYERDYEYDDGNADLPPSKRLAAMINERDPGEMEYEDQNEEGDQRSDEMQYEEIYETQPTAESLLKTPTGRNLAKQFIERHFKGNLAKDYFLKLIKGGRTVDHTYGVRIEGDDWMIGDKKIEVDESDLIINDKRYSGTRGLYELIFMNSPNPYIYTEEDLKNYGYILNDTNVYRVNYSASGNKRSNRGHKYLKIIAPIINQQEGNSSTGSGLNKKPRERKPSSQAVAINPMTTLADTILPPTEAKGLVLTEKNPEYIYFDDPNELVDRLRLLYGTSDAGNNGCKNEINSIIEELLELEKEGVIDV